MNNFPPKSQVSTVVADPASVDAAHWQPFLGP